MVEGGKIMFKFEQGDKGVGVYRAIGYTAFGILLLLTLYFFFPPVTAITYDWYTLPVQYQDPNVGTVSVSSSYASESLAAAAICTNSTTTVNNGGGYNVWTNAWGDAATAHVVNGSYSWVSGYPNGYLWNTNSTVSIYQAVHGCRNPGGTVVNNYYYRTILRTDRLYNSTLTSDFYATPISGVGPVYVSFFDNSTGAPATVWNWSISPVTGWLATPTDLDNRDLTVLFTTNGNYTITHGAANQYTSDIETKTDYIQIYNSSETVTTQIHLTDLYSGWPIQSASLNMKDIENNSWTNVTTGTNGAGEITTLMNNHINAYGSASGYDDNDLLNVLADGSGYSFSLMPTGFSNVTAGNVTLYVTVVDDDTTFRLAGATVNIGSSVIIGGDFHSVTTNAAGVAKDVVKNNTIVHLYTSKSGYNGVSSTVNTGTGSGGSAHVDVEVRLTKSVITPTATITTLPGGGYPTVAPTYLPNCDPGKSDYNDVKCRQSHSNSGLNFLAEHMEDLIMLCVFVTMMYLLGFKLGK
jgi:PKD repeat protein